MIRFKKTSPSPPVFVYFTIHFDDKGGDLNTYPREFKNQIYLVAYGVEGLTDHVDSEVYDAHEAFEIDKTKMKMLVPLDMNNQRIMNTNFDLKFGNLFKIIKCLLISNPPHSQNVIQYYIKKLIVVIYLLVFEFQLLYIHLFYQKLLFNVMIKHL